MAIFAMDGVTVQSCGNCRWYQITNQGFCQRYPDFVARQPNEVSGEWSPNDATQTTILDTVSANLLAAASVSAIIPTPPAISPAG